MFGKKTKLVTHNGTFHADDVFACAALRIYFKDKVTVTRTRDSKIIKNGDVVFDVGGIHDPETMRFDHHQKNFEGKRENGIIHSSFGLVWKKIGVELCGSKEAAGSIDQHLVQAIDAYDNGFNLTESKIEGAMDYGISHAIMAMRPAWNETNLKDDEQFSKAVSLVKIILEREIIRSRAFQESKVEVEKAYAEAENKKLIVFDISLSRQDILPILGRYPEPVYFIYPKGEGAWKLEGVRKNKESFELRKDLPASWAGLKGEDFQKETGVDDAMFSHNGLFLAVALTKDGVLKLAKLALEE